MLRQLATRDEPSVAYVAREEPVLRVTPLVLLERSLPNKTSTTLSTPQQSWVAMMFVLMNCEIRQTFVSPTAHLADVFEICTCRTRHFADRIGSIVLEG